VLWRWLLVLSCLATAIVILLKPWEKPSVAPVGLATYTPPPISNTKKSSAIATLSPRNSVTVQQPAIQPITPRTLSFPVGTELHAIGVYKGALAAGETEKPWWMKCPSYINRQNGGSGDIDMKAHRECHSKYAGLKSTQTITVNVSRSKSPIVLALMSYDPVIWSIEIGRDVDIRRIIVGGYHGQDVNGISSNIPVDLFTHKASSCKICTYHSGYFYAYKWGSKNYKKAMAKLNGHTGLTLQSFQSTYEGKRFYISSTTGS